MINSIIETWLSAEDIQRLWQVVMENAPEFLATENELLEFARIMEIAGQHRLGIYHTSETLH